MVRLCCEDDEWRTTGLLQVKIKKPENTDAEGFPGNWHLRSA